ncbi:hypothetical protein V8B97DRAFT_1986962 [Scleroderma yunnanense]
MGKTRAIEQSSSDDDAPEIISTSKSRASARRDQKALRNFEAEEKARRKTRNRERDTKLKERALTMKTNKRSKLTDAVESGNADEKVTGEEEDEDMDMDMSGATDDGNDERMKARMHRAMQNAVEEDEADNDEEREFRGFGGELDDDEISADSGSEDAIMSHEGNSDSSAENPEKVSEDSTSEEEEIPASSRKHRPIRQPQYLSDDLFAAAFASQKSTPSTQKTSLVHQEATRKRPRKPSGRPKDIVVGGRTIRTLTRLSDPKSKATARTLPPARARAFVDRSLAVKGKGATMKAKKRGWERRPGKLYY